MLQIKLGTVENPQTIKVNAQMTKENMNSMKKLLKYKDVFAWTYKDLKGIPPKLAQHCIELDTLIPPAHHVVYIVNPSYVTTIKHDIDKLLVVGYIYHVEEATWLSSIIIIHKKNGKLGICVTRRKLCIFDWFL
jgi:hypothetical protein